MAGKRDNGKDNIRRRASLNAVEGDESGDNESRIGMATTIALPFAAMLVAVDWSTKTPRRVNWRR